MEGVTRVYVPYLQGVKSYWLFGVSSAGYEAAVVTFTVLQTPPGLAAAGSSLRRELRTLRLRRGVYEVSGSMLLVAIGEPGRHTHHR